MKKFLYILFIIIYGCSEYEVPQPYSVNVIVNYPEQINNGDVIADAKILLQNKETGREYSSISDEHGIAIFSVRGGIYDIIVSFSEKKEIEIEGYSTLKNIQINGSIRGYQILENNLQIEIETDYTIINEGFIIKELYTSGSRTPEGKTYNPDKFVEIYNNSDQVLYSDGLCFGIVRHKRTYTPNPWVDSEGNMLSRIPVWSYVAIVPGAGDEFPIQPGKSFVIALSGLNHRDNPNGNSNSIDLSSSEWEMYVEDGKYIDIPSVPNIFMQQIHKNSYANSIAINSRGHVSIIFRVPNNDINSIFSNPDNFMVEPYGTEPCFMVPYSWIIDGVENPELNDLVYKRLPNNIDIGYIQHRGSGERVSIKRKVKEVINGRTVYQDTNNSTVDFLTNQEPTPGVIAKN